MATGNKAPRSVTDELLAAAKNYLDRTWEDVDGDRKLSGILAGGIARLDEIAGRELTYELGTPGRDLLFERTRYVLANQLKDFEADYTGELMSLNMHEEVDAYAGGTV